MNKVKMTVSGYGVIGKRVADAVRRQDDMELIGKSSGDACGRGSGAR